MPRWAHPYFVTQRLIGLGEKERPVCIGEYVVRSCSAFVNKAVSAQKDREYFMKMVKERYALQLGNAVPGGQEVVVHLLNTLVHEPGAKRVVLSDDGKNAYNATDRVGACNRTMSENPVCARWVAWCYGTNAMLVNDAGVVWGKEGVFQGDPLGGRIHDTAFQPALELAVKRTAVLYPNSPVHVIAFRDDAYVVGEAEAALYCHKQLVEERRVITGVEGAPEKFEAYCPLVAFASAGEHEHAQTVLGTELDPSKIRTDGIKAVGAPVSNNPHTFTHSSPRVSTNIQIFSRA